MEHPSIGILAGMGPQSTGPFVDMVVAECARQYGAVHDIDFPKMMICSQPAPFFEDRPVDHAALAAAIGAGLADLERTGVDFLAIACNTAHVYYPDLAASVGIPLLDMVEIAAAAIPGGTRSVAVIAAEPTVRSGIYQRALAARGITVPEDVRQADVNALLGLVRRAPTADDLRAAWASVLAPAEGVDAVLVACLDLSAVLAHAPGAAPLVDAARCLAEEVVRTWLRLRER